MPIDFVLFGLMFIYTLFFVKQKYKYVALICNLLFLVSYFWGRVNYLSFSVNFLSGIAIFIMLAYLLVKINKKYLPKLFSVSVITTLIYVGVVNFNLYNLVSFNYWLYLITSSIFSLMLVKNINHSIFISLCNVMVVDVVSYFISLSHFEYYTFLSANLYKCLALNLSLIFIVKIFENLALFRRNNKSNIVLCNTEEERSER